jgi:DNA-binding MarR family transcriptional regulator
MTDTRISASARVLYFLLDDKAGDDGVCWWHHKKLALLLGLSKSEFFKNVKELKTLGLISKKRERRCVFYSLHTETFKIVQSLQAETFESPDGDYSGFPSLVNLLHEPVYGSADAETDADLPFAERFPHACRSCLGMGNHRSEKCRTCGGDGLTPAARKAGKKKPYEN